MNSFDRFLRWALSILVVCTMAFALGACDGDDGKDGAAGRDGVDGTDGAPAPVPDAVTAAIEKAQVESCSTCHGGVGDGHQALYNKYTDGSADAGTNLEMTFGAFRVAGAGPFDVELDFTVTQNGAPLADFAVLGLNRFYVTRWDPALGQYFEGTRIRTVTGANGAFTVAGELSFNPTTNASFYGYVGDEQVIIDDVNYAAHMGLYDNLASAGMETAGAGVYVSTANVEGCELCHGTPYMKHGNRAAAVAGLPDFASCKGCHFDDREGGHGAWQYMVDDPLGWATDVLPDEDAVNAAYPYTANVMNDTHMSHAMEFPYPQSMANCATCHAGNIDDIITDANFTAETCKSCHPVQGINAWPEDAGATLEGDYAQSHRAPPLEFLWTRAGMNQAFHTGTANCVSCHSDPAGPPGTGFASTFDQYHSGYDGEISDDAGNRYDGIYTVSIDGIAYDDVNSTLTVDFISSDPAILPEVLVSFYGWDSKHFIVASHGRDGSDLCPSSRGDGCRFEFAPGDTSPLFTEDAGNVAGDWSVTVNLAAYVPTVEPGDIPTMILNGDIMKVEVTLIAEFELDGVELALDAVTQTFDLGIGMAVNDYFKDGNAIVDIDKCDACHDQLGTTFHGGSGRGGDIVACRNCHNPTFDGSHVEMASRSTESYVHAIHTFQPFDLGDVDAADPVEVKRTGMHMEHTFPNFTITNCEGCHNPGTYNVPDQSQSMPGAIAGSDDVAGRNIGSVPSYVTGPASRACGGCHRAELINEDKAGDLASFNAHTEAFGTLVEYEDDDEVLFGIIDKIMTWFE